MGISDHQVFDVILILNRTGGLTPPTTTLRAIRIQRLGFRVATMRQCDDHILLRINYATAFVVEKALSVDNLFVFVQQATLLKTRQPVEPHLKNCLGLLR